METETHNGFGDKCSEPSSAGHEANALDMTACPRCYPRQYAANHARHKLVRNVMARPYLHAVGA